MHSLNALLATALITAGIAAGQAGAATSHSASVNTKAVAPGYPGPSASQQVSDTLYGSDKPVSFDLTTGLVSAQQDVTVTFDGRCVVIATGEACQGGEGPLTTMTVYNGAKPVMATQAVSAMATASAYAKNGRVGASAMSSASTGMSNARIDPANPAQLIPGRLYSTGDSLAQAFASMEHTNTLLGPVGGVATITLRGVASSDMFINSEPGLGNSAQVTMQVMGRAAPAGQRCSNFASGCVGEFSFSRWADPRSLTPIVLGSDRRTYDFSFQARTNDIVSLFTKVSVGTTNTGQADASHTLTIDEIELSDGFSFADEAGLTRSGNRYAFAAAVPEPGTWAMLVAGLLVIGAVARRTSPSRA